MQFAPNTETVLVVVFFYYMFIGFILFFFSRAAAVCHMQVPSSPLIHIFIPLSFPMPFSSNNHSVCPLGGAGEAVAAGQPHPGGVR